MIRTWVVISAAELVVKATTPFDNAVACAAEYLAQNPSIPSDWYMYHYGATVV